MGEIRMRFRNLRLRTCKESNKDTSVLHMNERFPQMQGDGRSVVAAMVPHMETISHRIEQSENVLASFRVESIKQDSVGSADLAGQLELGIIDDNVTVVANSERTSDLQDDFYFFSAWRSHASLRNDGFAGCAKLRYSMRNERFSVHRKEGITEVRIRQI
jgi:hypothetical protein